MEQVTEDLKTQLSAEIEELKTQLTGKLFDDMETRDKIHNLEMKLNGTKPVNTEIDCIGCSG